MKEGRMMKGNPIKFILVVMVFMVLFSTDVQAAKLNKTSLTLQKGKTYTLKLQGSKKKATWKTKNKKIASLSNKKKTSVKIKAVKAGKTTITAKVGKKTYKCKVTVVNPTAKKNDKDTPGTDADKTDEQTTDATTEEKTEKTPAKKKVWIITKWGEIVYTPVYVNKRSQWECTCGYKTEDSDAFDKHHINHILKEEPCAWRVNTIWDSCYYVTVEYPEQGYWTEIGADEYPEGMKWRVDTSYPAGGYWYIDKSGN